MSCRMLVVALGLLVSSPALAQSPDSDGGASDGQSVTVPAVDSAPDAGLDAGWPDRRRPRPALAGLRDACGIDADGDGVIEGVGECPPVVPAAPGDGGVVDAEAKWNVELETVIATLASGFWGEGSGTVSSTLLTARYRPLQQFAVGAVVPFAFGSWDPSCGSVKCHSSSTSDAGPFANLGELALFATWEPHVGRATRLPVGLLLALPTASGRIFRNASGWGPQYVAEFDRNSELAEVTRALADPEFFNEGFVALVPNVGVSFVVGRVTLAASVKLAMQVRTSSQTDARFRDAPFVLAAVEAAQVLVRVVDRPRGGLSGGLRVFGVFNTWQGRLIARGGEGLDPPAWCRTLSMAIEPRVEAHIGQFELRTGVVIQLVHSDEYGNTQSFPQAWGVRVGVGYSF